jgi:hypothetical protein
MVTKNKIMAIRFALLRIVMNSTKNVQERICNYITLLIGYLIYEDMDLFERNDHTCKIEIMSGFFLWMEGMCKP